MGASQAEIGHPISRDVSFPIRKSLLDGMGINALAVFTLLRTCADPESGTASPSIAIVAKRLKTSERTVSRALDVLLRLNALTKTKVGRKNHYTFVDQFRS